MNDRLVRVRQTLFHLWFSLPGHGQPVGIPDGLAIRLLPGTEPVFRDLSPADQAHSIVVAMALLDHADAPDAVVIAGMLHDIGKIRGRRTISIPHRVAYVLLCRIAPGVIDRLRRHTDPPCGTEGLWALAVHDVTGERIVRDLGYSEQVQWLVRHHQTRIAGNPDLALLQAMDSRVPAIFPHYT